MLRHKKKKRYSDDGHHLMDVEISEITYKVKADLYSRRVRQKYKSLCKVEDITLPLLFLVYFQRAHYVIHHHDGSWTFFLLQCLSRNA